MPIPRKFDRRPPERDETRINERIRVPQVRLVGEDGNQIGIVDTGEALRYAQERDLDLVEVAPEARPPVCRVLDYYMPERFELAYTGADNAEHQPVMIHRALMGSFERFIGILIEHYAGEFPLWLAPVQAAVLPIADRHLDYAGEVAKELRDAGLRVEVDDRSESVGRKIRDAELRKLPYMLVVGDQEESDRKVAVRRHHEGDIGAVEVAEFARSAAEEVRERRPRRA